MLKFIRTFKFVFKQVYIKGFMKGYKEGYRKGKISGKKGFVKSNPKIFDSYLDIFNNSLDLAIKGNQVSFEKYNPPSPLSGKNILARGCLYKIGERAVILHRSTLSLCEDGWASVVSVILRSLIDCLINSLAIINKDSEYMAFKFYIHELLNTQLDANISQDVKDFNMEQINQQLIRLDQRDQKRAKEYIKEFLKRTEPKSYWYRPEYKSAKQILGLCRKDSGMYELYKDLSLSIHSTFIGSNMFKDQPDKVDINPRSDPKSTRMVLIGSSRLLLETTSIGERFESLNLSSECQALRIKISRLKQDFYDQKKMQEIGQLDL